MLPIANRAGVVRGFEIGFSLFDERRLSCFANAIGRSGWERRRRGRKRRRLRLQRDAGETNYRLGGILAEAMSRPKSQRYDQRNCQPNGRKRGGQMMMHPLANHVATCVDEKDVTPPACIMPLEARISEDGFLRWFTATTASAGGICGLPRLNSKSFEHPASLPSQSRPPKNEEPAMNRAFPTILLLFVLCAPALAGEFNPTLNIGDAAPVGPISPAPTASRIRWRISRTSRSWWWSLPATVARWRRTMKTGSSPWPRSMPARKGAARPGGN